MTIRIIKEPEIVLTQAEHDPERTEMKVFVAVNKFINRIVHRELTKEEVSGRYGFRESAIVGHTWCEAHQKLLEIRRQEFKFAEKELKRVKASLEKLEAMKEPT